MDWGDYVLYNIRIPRLISGIPLKTNIILLVKHDRKLSGLSIKMPTTVKNVDEKKINYCIFSESLLLKVFYLLLQCIFKFNIKKMKKEFISILQAFGFYQLVSGNEADNQYHFKQFMIAVTDNEWMLFYDRLGSNIRIFKNTYLGSATTFCIKDVSALVNNNL